MVKHILTIRRPLPTNSLSVFDHFVWLALIGFTLLDWIEKYKFLLSIMDFIGSLLTGHFIISHINVMNIWHVQVNQLKINILYVFSKCDQIGRKMWIWSHLLKKSLMENFVFCAVHQTHYQWIVQYFDNYDKRSLSLNVTDSHNRLFNLWHLGKKFVLTVRPRIFFRHESWIHITLALLVFHKLVRIYFWVLQRCIKRNLLTMKFPKGTFHLINVSRYISTPRSSRPEVLLGKVALKICSKFPWEHSCRSLISIKLQSNFIEITLWQGCSPEN